MEARAIGKDSKRRRVNIERFAYDVFSYMLPICGFPETAIPISNIGENDYNDEDLVKKCSLSVFEISMSQRDRLRRGFEARHHDTPFNNSKIIQSHLESALISNGIFMEIDEEAKVRVSLSFFNELALFLNYKNLETRVEKFPQFWKDFYLENITTNQDIEGLLKFPALIESKQWIIRFINDFAVPYGKGEVSEVFRKRTDDADHALLREILFNNANKFHNVPNTSDASNKKSAPSLLKKSNPSSNGFSEPTNLKGKKSGGRQSTASTNVLEQREKVHKKSSSEQEVKREDAKANGRQSTTSTVLELDEKVHRKSPLEQEVDDALQQMNLGSGHTSQEARPKRGKANKKNNR